MKVAFHTLGCKVNQYETEAIARDFRMQGFEVVDEREFADVYVINTCTVTAIADKKSRQYIRRMKKINPDSIVAVTGCYAQIKPEEVSAVEGVDIVAGTNEKSRLAAYVSEYLAKGIKQVHVQSYDELAIYEETGAVSSIENRTRAYIKIQEGCNRFCAYCVIPYARGRIRSRSLESIVSEAQKLIAAGYRELVLTGINTALYDMESANGHDGTGFAGGKGGFTSGGRGISAGAFCDLGDEPYGVEKAIAALDQLPGDFRIRLSSLEPAVVNADYVKRLLKYDKLCHHMHLSAQSGSDRILTAMNRPYDRDQYLDIVRVLRDFDPHYGISTDIIVGFPGEKETDFEESCNLVETCGFCKTHIFKYSKRPFTQAAQMSGQIAPEVKNRRSETLHKIGKKAAGAFFQRNCGRVETVLLEEVCPEKKLIMGYSGNYTKVYVQCRSADVKGLVNQFAKVKLLAPYEEGVFAEFVEAAR